MALPLALVVFPTLVNLCCKDVGPRDEGPAAPDLGKAPASGSPLSLLKVVLLRQAVAARGGVQGHEGLLITVCEVGASLQGDDPANRGLAEAPRIPTPSSLLVLHGEPGSVISLVPLLLPLFVLLLLLLLPLLHSPQDTVTPLKQQQNKFKLR